MSPAPPVLKLYFSRMCPYVHRVTTTLHLLGMISSLAEGLHTSSPLAHIDMIHIDLANKPVWFAKDVNPKGTVPVLIVPAGTTSNGHGNGLVTLADSDDITSYLLQLYAADTPTALLRPHDALARYTLAVPLLDTWNDEFVPAFYALLKEQDKAKVSAVKDRLVAATRAVESRLVAATPTNGTFALGQDLTVVDILCAGFLARLPVLKHYRGFDMPAELARFAAWRKAVVDHKSVQATLAPVDELAVAYKRLAGEATV